MPNPILSRNALSLLAGLVVLHAHGAELPTVSPEAAGLSPKKLIEVSRITEDLIQDKKLAGATVMIARRGKVGYFKTFGKMDIEAGRPMREDAIFRIYSMSKSITTAAALMLHDDGKLELDAPISKYLPEFKGATVWNGTKAVPARREPSVRDLMRHTAGFTYGSSTDPELDKLYKAANLMNPDQDLASLCSRLSKLPLQYEPGTQWIYSIATDVLGHVVEKVSGQGFDAFLQQRLFAPLDMKDTGFFVPAEKTNRFVTLYNAGKNKALTPADAASAHRYFSKPAFLSGGGGLVSTTRDYMRFLQMVAQGGQLDGQRLLKKETVGLMTHNELSPEAMPIAFGTEKRHGVGFGLGFNVRTENTAWDPSARLGEYGWGGLASTHYWASPKDDLVVVTMEQTLPYSFQLEWALKGKIYEAVKQ